MTTPASGSDSERVLIVEDDAAQRVGLQQLVRSWGFTADAAIDGQDAIDKLPTVRPTIVLSDLVMPRVGGLDLLTAIRQDDPAITVVLMTGQGTVESAVSAIKAGAYDYVSKPVDPQRLKILLDQIVARHADKRKIDVMLRRLGGEGKFGKMIGTSAEIQKIYKLVEQSAPTVASVLISGESGTGKELVAQTIHELSPRESQHFLPLNCAAIPDTLLESELFGHEKGAFTGAFTRRQGAFELANRGTLFLDEIAEMTPATQAKLLRVLQERSFRPVGGQREQSVDVRVIAATNIDPPEAVRQGKLREDLFYRLNVFPIQLPPLRERKGDVSLLAQSFLREFSGRNGRAIAGFSPAALDALERHTWPGNVRELRNVIERATIIAKTETIEAGDLPMFSSGPSAPHAPAAASAGHAHPAGAPAGAPVLTPGLTVDEAERQLIELTLAHTGGNKTRAADMLGISLKTLHNKLNRMKEEEALGSGL